MPFASTGATRVRLMRLFTLGFATIVLLSFATTSSAQAQPRIWKVPGTRTSVMDYSAREVLALDRSFVMNNGDPTLLMADDGGHRIVRIRFDKDGRQNSEVVAGLNSGTIGGFTPDGGEAKQANITAISVAHTY